jgi:hypothetical protein
MTAMDEKWHWKKAICAATTGTLAVVLAFGHANATPGNGPPVAPVRALGIVFLLVVLAATAVTRFWSSYDYLHPAGKILAWAAFLPGAVFWFIEYWFLRLLLLIVVAALSG